MRSLAPLETLSRAALLLILTIVASGLVLTGCKRQNSVQINFQMGEKVTAGDLTYNVVQSVWRSQMGEPPGVRTPQNRFLVITLSASNGGSREVNLPFVTLEGPNGQEYKEIEEGTGIENWFGLLRTLPGGETRQGNLVFDVPLTSYRLRLTDGGEPGVEKFVWVEIPLRIESDTSIPSPVPGQR